MDRTSNISKSSGLTTLLLAAAAALTLSACGGEASHPSVSQEPDYNTKLGNIALVTTSATINDTTFNSGVWEGLDRFATEYHAPHAFYQPNAKSIEARERSMLQAIKEGAGVVVVPGNIFGPLMMTVPAQHPDVKFIALDVDPATDMEGMEPPDNLYCVSFAEEQSGFLAGYAAVKEGYTHLGFLGGGAVPTVVRYGQGYLQGIDAAARELECFVEVKYNYAGHFSGDAEVSRHMSQWYDDGTEVVFACGGTIWTSPVQAAMYHDGMVIGVDSDQSFIGRDTVNFAYNPFLTSATKALGQTVYDALTLAYNDQFDAIGGTWERLTLADGDCVGLPTAPESWGFRRFTVPVYQHIKERLAEGDILVDSNSAPDFRFETSEYVTVDYDA